MGQYIMIEQKGLRLMYLGDRVFDSRVETPHVASLLGFMMTVSRWLRDPFPYFLQSLLPFSPTAKASSRSYGASHLFERVAPTVRPVCDPSTEFLCRASRWRRNIHPPHSSCDVYRHRRQPSSDDAR